MYIDKLDDVVNKYKNTCRSTIKMKPIAVKSAHILILIKRIMKKILSLKLVILLEYQKYKNFFAKGYIPN